MSDLDSPNSTSLTEYFGKAEDIDSDTDVEEEEKVEAVEKVSKVSKVSKRGKIDDMEGPDVVPETTADESADEVGDFPESSPEYITEVAVGQKLDTDYMDLIKQEHDPEKHRLLSTYDIVKRFLIDNKRILAGGMAIDYALRAKGTKLYTSDKIDYDFLTPDFHNDAYKIAKLISQNPATKSVHVINAMHTSTMRVRYRYVYVADSTYIPEKIYSMIPTINHESMTIVHPCYQMLDQHLALSLPYANSPIENVLFKRWRHDITRFELLSDYYDVESEITEISKRKHTTSKFITDEVTGPPDVKEHILDIDDIENQCIAGYGAYAYWMNKSGNLEYKFEVKGDKVSYTAVTDVITLLSNNFTKLIPKLPAGSKSKTKITYYLEFLDKLMPRVTVDKYEIFDNASNMVSAEKLEKIEKHNVYVAGIQHTMLYMGVKAMFYNDPYAAIAYVNLHRLCLAGIKEHNSKFVFGLEYYGEYNQSASDVLLLKKQCSYMNEKKITIDIPPHYYPKENDSFPKFDIKKTTEYDFNGEECEPFSPTKPPVECDNLV